MQQPNGSLSMVNGKRQLGEKGSKEVNKNEKQKQKKNEKEHHTCTRTQ